MNVCVAHFQMNRCVAKNFGASTENVGALSQIWRIACLEVAHCSLCNLNFDAWSEKFGHPCTTPSRRLIFMKETVALKKLLSDEMSTC